MGTGEHLGLVSWAPTHSVLGHRACPLFCPTTQQPGLGWSFLAASGFPGDWLQKQLSPAESQSGKPSPHRHGSKASCLLHRSCGCLPAWQSLPFSCLPAQSGTQASTVSCELGRSPPKIASMGAPPSSGFRMRDLGRCPVCPGSCLTCTTQARVQEPPGMETWHERLWGKNPRWCNCTFQFHVSSTPLSP